MEYIFKYKKNILWTSIKVEGHKYDSTSNRMDLFLKDGSIYSIGEWSKYTLKLGTDWVIAQRKIMEKEAGQKIELNGNKGE